MASVTTHVTVFGATGFIGQAFIADLARLNVTIHIATRRPQAANALRTCGTVGQIVPVACDIHDDASVAQAVTGSDWVVNLVGILAEKGKRNRFDAVHHLFPKRLASACTAHNVQRLVHVSALGAAEDAPSDYAKSKAAGERAILAYFAKASILRPSIVFGREDGFFNRFAQMAGYLPFLPLIGGGHTLFQPVYVRDVSQAIMACLTKNDGVQGQIFELGGDERFSFKELLQKIAQVTGVKRPLVAIPTSIAKIQGATLQRLPGQLLTVDQVRSLSVDNVLSGHLPGLRDLGITPMALDVVLPDILSRYTRNGFLVNRRHAP